MQIRPAEADQDRGRRRPPPRVGEPRGLIGGACRHRSGKQRGATLLDLVGTAARGDRKARNCCASAARTRGNSESRSSLR